MNIPLETQRKLYISGLENRIAQQSKNEDEGWILQIRYEELCEKGWSTSVELFQNAYQLGRDSAQVAQAKQEPVAYQCVSPQGYSSIVETLNGIDQMKAQGFTTVFPLYSSQAQQPVVELLKQFEDCISKKTRIQFQPTFMTSDEKVTFDILEETIANLRGNIISGLQSQAQQTEQKPYAYDVPTEDGTELAYAIYFTKYNNTLPEGAIPLYVIPPAPEGDKP